MEKVNTQINIGVEKWPDGAVYEGEYKNAKKNGFGKFLWADGSSYEGNFKDNMLEGKGNILINSRYI